MSMVERGWLRTAVQLLMAAGVSVLAVGVSLWLGVRLGDPLYGLPIFVVAYLAIPVHVMIHEGGHLVAAVALRRPIRELAIFARPGSRRFTVAGVKVRIGWFGGISHLVSASPVAGESTPMQQGLLYLAGPAANALFGVAAAFLAFIFEAEPAVSFGLYAVSVGAFLTVLVTILPTGIGECANDGAHVVNLLRARNRPKTEAVLAQLRERAADPTNRWRTFEQIVAERNSAERAGSRRLGMGDTHDRS